jgi:hypothetical protein
VIYREQLERMRAEDRTFEVFHTITREPPPGWSGFSRRVDRAMLREVAFPPANDRGSTCAGRPPSSKSPPTSWWHWGTMRRA